MISNEFQCDVLINVDKDFGRKEFCGKIISEDDDFVTIESRGERLMLGKKYIIKVSRFNDWRE